MTKKPELDFELVPIGDLKPHPRNYQEHPPDQLEHIVESLKEHGVYRPIVTAKDLTILAGHGIWEGLKLLEIPKVAIKRMDYAADDPRAYKLLTGDNEISRLAERDDRALSELLKEVRDFDDDGLLGTGYDDRMLMNLVYVTRPQSEIESFDEAAEWVGMPEYESPEAYPKLTVSFRSEEDKAKFGEFLEQKVGEKTKSIWWPAKERDDMKNVRFEESEEPVAAD